MTKPLPPGDHYVLAEPAFGVIRAHLRPETTVLDIGCGFGNFGRFFTAAGARVDGIEPDPNRASFAQEGLRVWNCGMEEASRDAGIGTYDVVTVPSPVDALMRTKQFLAPGGRVFLFVPNSAHWTFRVKVLRGDWSYADWGLFDRTHLRFFDLATASSLCREAGLKRRLGGTRPRVRRRVGSSVDFCDRRSLRFTFFRVARLFDGINGYER